MIFEPTLKSLVYQTTKENNAAFEKGSTNEMRLDLNGIISKQKRPQETILSPAKIHILSFLLAPMGVLHYYTPLLKVY